MTQGMFLYFLPDKRHEEVKREDLASNPFTAGPFFELIHSPKVFRERLLGGNVSGPDGKNGCIVAIKPQVEIDQIPGYFPARQTWQQFGGQWIGYETEMKPGPESLRRASLISGHEVELGDGKVWQAPVIRPFHEQGATWGCSLPMNVGLDAKAERVTKVLDRYRFAWELSGRVADILINGQSGKVSEMFGDAVASLSLNYRIGEAEATLLELFDTQTIEECLRATIDGPLIDEFLQRETEKNPPVRPDAARHSHGSQDCGRAISPAAAS